MVKLIYCFCRKADLSVEEFRRYWREVHGPIAARIPGVRRYVQSHVLPAAYQGDSSPAYDGVAELWFDSFEALQAALRSPEVRAAAEDERKFIDHSRAALIFTEENVVIGGPTS